jgi:hypothetical protein
VTVLTGSSLAVVLQRACEMRGLAPADYRLFDTQRGAFVSSMTALVSPDLHLKLRSGPPAVPGWDAIDFVSLWFLTPPQLLLCLPLHLL